MRIAIPVFQGRLAEDFDQCSEIEILETLHQDNRQQVFFPPTMDSRRLPLWLQKRDVDIVIAGRLDERVVRSFEKAGIMVIQGAPSLLPTDVVRRYLTDQLSLH